MRYKTRSLQATWIAGILLLLAGAGCQPYEYKGAVIEPGLAVDDFSAPLADGSVFTLSDQKDGVTLMYFGYTFCPDVCPATMYKLGEAYEALEADTDQVRVVMVTVDPQRDTPDQVARYAKTFNEAFIGVSLEQATLDAVAKQFGVGYIIEENPDNPDNYLITHTSRVFVIDPEMRVRLMIHDTLTPDEIARDIQHFLRRN